MKEEFLSKWSNWWSLTKDAKRLNEAFAKELDAIIAHEVALRQPPVSRSLRDCKEEWASNYDKTWEEVQKDFEYGNGLSKMWDFEKVMDMVAELYKKQ